MKQIILTNPGETSDFVASLEDLTIEKNSKIALDSLSVAFQSEYLISDDNNEMEFSAYANSPAERKAQELGNNSITVTIPNGIYNSRSDILKTVEASLNAEMPNFYEANMDNYKGLQFECLQDENHVASIHYARGDLGKVSDFTGVNFNINAAAPAGETGVWAVKNSGDPAQFDGSIVTTKSISKSNNAISATLKLLNQDSVFIIGVYSIDPDGVGANTDKYRAVLYTTNADHLLRVYISESDRFPLVNGLLVDVLDNTYTITSTHSMNFEFVYGNDEMYFLIHTNGTTFTSVEYNFDTYKLASQRAFFQFKTQELNNAYFCIDDNVAGNASLAFQSVMNPFESMDEITRQIERVHPLTFGSTLENLGVISDATRNFKFTSNLAMVLGFNVVGLVLYGDAGNSVLASQQAMPNYLKALGFEPNTVSVQLPNIPITSFTNLTYGQNILRVIPTDEMKDYTLSFVADNHIYLNLRNSNKHDLKTISVKVTDSNNLVLKTIKNSMKIIMIIKDDSDI